ncbi:MAG: hypothetical protein AB7Q37_17340 [Pyrinomonadaceae bacterium]
MYVVRTTLSAAILIFGAVSAFGQDSLLRLGEGVKAHAGIDRIYSDFSKSYETLDHKRLAGLYTEDAAYLLPDQEIVIGQAPIEAIFKSFFDQIKASGRSISIEFVIVKRTFGDKLGYDIGTFEIKSMLNGKVSPLGTGKFVVVTKLGSDKKWRFAVDGYSELPKK